MRYSAVYGPPYTCVFGFTLKFYLYLVLALRFLANSVLTSSQFSEHEVSMPLFVAFLCMPIILDEYWKRGIIVGKYTYTRHLPDLKIKPASTFPFFVLSVDMSVLAQWVSKKLLFRGRSYLARHYFLLRGV